MGLRLHFLSEIVLTLFSDGLFLIPWRLAIITNVVFIAEIIRVIGLTSRFGLSWMALLRLG